MTSERLSDYLERRLVALVRVLLLIIALAYLAGALPAFRYAGAAISHGYALDREEGFLAVQAQRLRAGLTIYPDLENYPFLVGNYPPLFPGAGALLTPLFEGELAALRCLALASAVVLLLSLGALVWLATRQIELALLAAAQGACAWDTMSWLPYARVDFPAIALSVLGLVAFVAIPGRVRLVVAGALFVAAFYTKQTQLAAPAAVAAALWLSGDRRTAIKFAVGTAAGALLIFAGFTAATGGEFWSHLVTYNRNVWEHAQFAVWLRHFWLFESSTIIAAVIALGAAALRIRIEEAPTNASAGAPVLPIYAALCLLTIFTTGKAGAAENYLVEPQIGLGIVVALSLQRVCLPLDESAPRWLQRMNPGVLFLVFLLLFTKTFSRDRPSVFAAPSVSQRWATLQRGASPDPRLAEAGAWAELLVRDAEGEVLAEDPTLLLRAGRDVPYQPFIMSQLAREGLWDESAFVSDLKGARFSLLVLSQDLEAEGHLWGFTEPMREAILGAYRRGPSREVGRVRYIVYLPREATP